MVEKVRTVDDLRKEIIRHGCLEDIQSFEDLSFGDGFLAGFGKGYKQGEKAGLVGSQHPQKHKCRCGSWKTYYTQYGWRCKKCFESEFKDSRLRRKKNE